jgi:hypothetical protein
MASPSGDQSGKLLMDRFAVAARAFVPSAFITKISLFPPRSETKAISVPDTPRSPRKASTMSSAMRRAAPAGSVAAGWL